MKKSEKLKKNHPEVSLLRISHFLYKIKDNALLIKTRKRETLKQVQGGSYLFTATKAFTLIELLVVVLIIGILAAVALPQYQKAVIKSRYSNLKVLTRAMADAEEVYYLANGSYTADLDTLGVMPEGKLDTSTQNKFVYPWGSCFAHTPVPGTPTAVVGCSNSIYRIGYEIYLLFSPNETDRQKCVVENATSENDVRNQLCKAETRTSFYSYSGKTYWWTYK